MLNANTVSKLALLAVFGSTVFGSLCLIKLIFQTTSKFIRRIVTEESDTNTMPVPDHSSSSETSEDISGKENFKDTIHDVPEQYTLEIIQSQLDAFEKRLLNDYAAQGKLPETDLKLPMMVIDNFSRIFRLWHNNSVLKNSIQSKVFYDIFSSMFRSLNEEPTVNGERTGEHADLSDLTGVCDICDEEFELIQNDAQKSFAEHERSAAHIEAVNLFNKIGTGDLKQTIVRSHDEGDTVKKRTRKSKCTKQEIDDVWKQNSYCLKLLNGNISNYECFLCDVVCDSNQTNVKNHCNSMIHKKHRSYFLNESQSTSKRMQFNDDLIFSRENSFYCVLCQCIEPKQYRYGHVKTENHIGWKNFARKVIKLENPYFHKIDQNSDICVCELCNTKFNVMNGIPHCQTKRHILLKIFADEIRCLFSK